MKKIIRLTGYLIPVFLLVGGVFSEETPKDDSSKSYSPYADQPHQTNVYWGDTHLHTKLSADSYMNGNRLTSDDAYRFARGDTITTSSGQQARLSRPLDFLVIADHAYNMGVLDAAEAGDQRILRTELGARWATWLNRLKESDAKKTSQIRAELEFDTAVRGNAGDNHFRHSVWKDVAALADKHNEPGSFTALIGFEWTSFVYNLHRVVIFQDAANRVGSIIPFTQYDSSDPERLWTFLDDYTQKTGGDVLAIPHNGNRSRGAMFALEDAKGNLFSTQYANTRSRWEPLYEVTQIKGDSETHLILSPTDEFADYETWPNTNKAGLTWYEKFRKLRNDTDYEKWFEEKNRDQPNTDWQRTYEYARSALKLGLKEQEIGRAHV